MGGDDEEAEDIVIQKEVFIYILDISYITN